MNESQKPQKSEYILEENAKPEQVATQTEQEEYLIERVRLTSIRCPCVMHICVVDRAINASTFLRFKPTAQLLIKNGRPLINRAEDLNCPFLCLMNKRTVRQAVISVDIQQKSRAKSLPPPSLLETTYKIAHNRSSKHRCDVMPWLSRT